MRNPIWFHADRDEIGFRINFRICFAAKRKFCRMTAFLNFEGWEIYPINSANPLCGLGP
jgi:hypothetical protein